MSGKLAVADVFTVDFNEEATAGFGDLFWEQATFVNDAVAAIRSLYQKEFGELFGLETWGQVAHHDALCFMQRQRTSMLQSLVIPWVD
jgi:PGAP1-like protein